MALYSRRRHQERKKRCFISMTDLMISVLFIIMILMAYFSLRTEPNVKVIDRVNTIRVVVELLVAKEEIKELKELIRQLQLIYVKRKKRLQSLKASCLDLRL